MNPETSQLSARPAVIAFSKASLFTTGSEPGSMYPTLNPREVYKPEQVVERRLAEAAEMFAPFSGQQVIDWAGRKFSPEVFAERSSGTQIMGLPSRKGVTFYNAVAEGREAIESGDMDRFNKIMVAAAQNRLDPNSIIREIKRRVMSGRRREVGIPQRFDTSGQPVAAGETR